jgi:hypothetical protein
VWTAGFLAFPLAGLAGLAAAGGRVDTPLAALVGGAVTGLVIGSGQVLASRRRLPALGWSAATSFGMGLGLLAGASAVGYRTDLAALVVQGALTGLVLGPVQAVALPTSVGRRRWVWAGASPVLWALGWAVTTLAGVDVQAQYTVFGATGALVHSAVSGLLLARLLPARLLPARLLPAPQRHTHRLTRR